MNPHPRLLAGTENAAMTPEERAHLDARIVYRKRPLADRMLEAAARLTKVEARERYDRLQALALKDGPLTEDDKAQMRSLRAEIEDHPSGCLLDQLLPLRGRGPQWLEEHIQEQLWTWAWWADYADMEVRAFMDRPGGLDHPEEHVQAVLDALPYPEGWKPETRR